MEEIPLGSPPNSSSTIIRFPDGFTHERGTWYLKTPKKSTLCIRFSLRKKKKKVKQFSSLTIFEKLLHSYSNISSPCKFQRSCSVHSSHELYMLASVVRCSCHLSKLGLSPLCSCPKPMVHCLLVKGCFLATDAPSFHSTEELPVKEDLVGPFPFRHVPCSGVDSLQCDWAKNPSIPCLVMHTNVLLARKDHKAQNVVVFMGQKLREEVDSSSRELTGRPAAILNRATDATVRRGSSPVVKNFSSAPIVMLIISTNRTNRQFSRRFSMIPEIVRLVSGDADLFHKPILCKRPVPCNTQRSISVIPRLLAEQQGDEGEITVFIKRSVVVIAGGDEFTGCSVEEPPFCMKRATEKAMSSAGLYGTAPPNSVNLVCFLGSEWSQIEGSFSDH
ncbi:unnamed protein product [Thlaspi arvense]|uniref:Uncharacterized protein n=1 Tax=Thlaspi arvense TaxID=13288 RepID=A0AAU9T196_THLAR|nr:unnamed protein product [Thlaspi arvense]